MPMHDQVLAFFGFSRLPFGKHLTPADIFPSETHQEVYISTSLTSLCRSSSESVA